MYPKWDKECCQQNDYQQDDCMPEDYHMMCHQPKMKCKTEKECVKTYKCCFKVYRICHYRTYMVCNRCGHEFDYHRHRAMCPKCMAY